MSEAQLWADATGWCCARGASWGPRVNEVPMAAVVGNLRSRRSRAGWKEVVGGSSCSNRRYDAAQATVTGSHVRT